MLVRPSVYAEAQRDDSRTRAIEEALRFKAPVTGMPRLVTCPTTLGGTASKPVDDVFLAYASGNSDPCYHERSDDSDVSRTACNSISASCKAIMCAWGRHSRGCC